MRFLIQMPDGSTQPARSPRKSMIPGVFWNAETLQDAVQDAERIAKAIGGNVDVLQELDPNTVAVVASTVLY